MLQPDITAAPTLQEQIFQHFLGQIAAHDGVTTPTLEAFQQLVADGDLLNRTGIVGDSNT